jgi:hypothetical protein
MLLCESGQGWPDVRNRRHARHSPSGHCPSTARFARAQDEACEAVGSGAQGRAFLFFSTWPVSRAPPVFLPYRRGRHAFALRDLGQGPDLGVHHPAAHRYATSPAPLPPRSSGS